MRPKLRPPGNAAVLRSRPRRTRRSNLARLSRSLAVPLRTVQIEHSVPRRRPGVRARLRRPAGRLPHMPMSGRVAQWSRAQRSSRVRMGRMNELIGAATLVVTAVGLWFAYNYSRQMALKLSETRLEAYSRLWEISGVAAPTRLDGWGDDGYLLLNERRELWAAMTDWYYAKGGGMLLAATTKDVYLNVKHNLTCESSDLRPADLADRISEELGLPAGHGLDDKVRGTLAIRLISLLRTQLKSDLAIYGATYSGKLNEYERFFLLHSGVNLRSKAWAKAAGLDTWWWRMRRRPAAADRSPKVKPQISPTRGRPQPSPLQGMSAILSVGGIARTPPSSREAMRKALNGSVGPAEADSGVPNALPGDDDVEPHPGTGP